MWTPRTPRAQFLKNCLNLSAAAQVDGARWEPFQKAHLDDDSTFRIESKARQIAWSFTVAAEAIANAVLHGKSTIFVSINQSEASEKIRYAKAVYDNLNIGGLPTVTSDTILALELSNGARLLSLPSRPPRGKAQMTVVLDEFAHCQQDRLIYTGALPVTTRGGRIRIGSSPLGASGMFWEVMEQQLKPFPGYNRIRTPWWKVNSFCRTHPDQAETMPTEERIERYANSRIATIYENMLLDDFQQEYECSVIDETIAWITWQLIKDNQDPELLCWHAKSVDEAMTMLPLVHRASIDGHIELSLVGGVDVGRKKDLTEITIVGKGKTNTPVRFMISLDRVRFDDQENCIRNILDTLPITSMLIDETGLGLQLAENLDNTVAQGVTFTNATKELWAVRARLQFERHKVPIPVDRELAYQIHSIKKKVSAAKNLIFDCAASEKHHADKFWSLALALWAGKDDERRPHFGRVPKWSR